LYLGGFDLALDSSVMVDRLLSMLNQVLISNQNLTMDNTFKVYINVLSIEHMRYKQSNGTKRKNAARIKPKHYGSRTNNASFSKHQKFWTIDIPQTFTPAIEVFKDKCLLLGVIFGYLQHCQFENTRDRRFEYAQRITNKDSKRQKIALKHLEAELSELNKNLKLTELDNSDFNAIAPKLSDYYKCQIFIFTGKEGCSKISTMYPKIYDDSLKPIFLYQPVEDESHVIFIRYVTAYFRSNLTVCIACQKKFKSINYKHLCNKKATCFSCRRFFKSDKTYLNSYLLKNFFCNGVVQNMPYLICHNCNLNIYSPHCLEGHRKICSKGWKCLKCSKYTYASGDYLKTQKDIEQNHVCGLKVCSFCAKSCKK